MLFRSQTNIPGLFAAGECDYAYHGANRLGANSLLSASFSGVIAGEAVCLYVQNQAPGEPVKSSVAETEVKRQQEINTGLMSRSDGENPYTLHAELGKIMQDDVRVERSNEGLDRALQGLAELKQRAKNLSLDDKSTWANAGLPYARQVQDMIVLGEVIAKSARMRDECRGSHYKPEFELKMPDAKPGSPEYDAYIKTWKSNNEKWLKISIAKDTEAGPEIEYKVPDQSVFPPEIPRDYR